MPKNPLLQKRQKGKFVEVPHSAGILDDFAVRKNVATREGTIEKVPVNDSDIVNKKYVGDNFVENSGDTMTGDLVLNDNSISFNDSGTITFGDSQEVTLSYFQGLGLELLNIDKSLNVDGVAVFSDRVLGSYQASFTGIFDGGLSTFGVVTLPMKWSEGGTAGQNFDADHAFVLHGTGGLVLDASAYMKITSGKTVTAEIRANGSTGTDRIIASWSCVGTGSYAHYPHTFTLADNKAFLTTDYSHYPSLTAPASTDVDDPTITYTLMFAM